MSDASSVELYATVESTPGETPSVPLDPVRFTGESFRADSQFIESNEIDPGRQVVDQVRTQLEPRGGFNIELSYGSHDVYLAGLMQSDFSTPLGISSATIGVTSGTGVYDGTGLFGALVPGQWVLIGGFSNSGNNGLKRVVAADSDSFTVDDLTGLVTEASGPTVTVDGSICFNDKVKKYFTLERRYADISPVAFHAFKGMLVDTMSLEVAPNAIATGGFEFIGRTPTIGASSAGDGTFNNPTTTEVMNAIDHVTALREGGAASALDFTRISLAVTNNLRGQPAIATFGNVDVGLGQFQVSGQLQAYFVGGDTLLSKYLDNTNTALAITFTDSAGNIYVIDLPKVKYTSGQAPAGGNNSDVIADLQWSASKGTLEGYTMAVNRFPAP